MIAAIKNFWDEDMTLDTLIIEFDMIIPKLGQYQEKICGNIINLRDEMKAIEAEMDVQDRSEKQIREIKMSQTDVYDQILMRYSKQYPCITKLIRMMIIFLSNSAGPERAFSTMNWIKNKRRSRISDVH